MIRIRPIPVLKDNYIWLLDDGVNALVVDPARADVVLKALLNDDLSLAAILLTHHHQDHIGGVDELRKATNCAVYGNNADRLRLPELTHALNPHPKQSVKFELLDMNWECLATPGHTIHHVCYFQPEHKLLFVGDTLFSAGCGRLFEGSASDLFQSFNQFRTLPEETLMHCAHEYTLANLTFALHLRPTDTRILQALSERQRLRNEGKPTLPSSLKTESEINLFYQASTVSELAHLRDLKDKF